jgi:hypothetical protein
LGHELVWRNDAVGQVGLRLPESQGFFALMVALVALYQRQALQAGTFGVVALLQP